MNQSNEGFINLNHLDEIEEESIEFERLNETLNVIESIKLCTTTTSFVEEYRLYRLSKDKTEAMIQHHRTFRLREEKIGGAE